MLDTTYVKRFARTPYTDYVQKGRLPFPASLDHRLRELVESMW